MSSRFEAFVSIFERDLDHLKKEIESYENEADLWVIDKNIKNSAGNLCLHICGNLQHFFGAVLTKDGYVRQREEEFGLKNIPREKLVDEIDAALSAVKNSFANLNDEIWSQNYPIQVFEEPMTTEKFVIHLSGHLMYHLGQINYHRRILAN